MELKDKIIMLRKQKALSQEGLADKLNVTRQTISKWELGESKPNIDTLNEMSKIFNVNIEVLTNDEFMLEEKIYKKEKEKKPKNRKYILYFLIVILIASIITLAIRIGTDKNRGKNSFWNLFNFSDIKDFKEGIDKETFNFFLKNETTSGLFLSNTIDEIIDSNKTNKEHLIEVVFDGTSYGKDTNKIGEIKGKIKSDIDSKYEVSLDYDENGYVNKVTITTKEIVSTTTFNHMFEFYSGTKTNASVRSLLDEVIKSNNKYKDYLVEVVYQNTSYGTDTEGIRNAKASIGTDSFKENGQGFKEYEVSLDYDDKGYVIKITIENL